MSKQFYVYIHKKPDGTPFYVGKGNGRRAYNFYCRSEWHKNIVAKYGKKNILIEIINCVNESQAFDLEKIYIKQIRDSGITLVNLTDGGEGHSGFKQNNQTKQKRAQKLKDFYASEKGKMVNQELNKHRIGRKNTDETKQKMRDATKGKPKSKAHIESLSKCHFGKPKKGHGIGLAGVNWVKNDKKWKVVSQFLGKSTFHGYFDNLLDAAACRIALQNKTNLI